MVSTTNLSISASLLSLNSLNLFLDAPGHVRKYSVSHITSHMLPSNGVAPKHRPCRLCRPRRLSTVFLILVFAFTFDLHMFWFWPQISVQLYIGLFIMHRPCQLGMWLLIIMLLTLQLGKHRLVLNNHTEVKLF